MLKIILPRRPLTPRLWKLPQICLPRARFRVDFPGAAPPPWREIEVERVLLAPLAQGWFIFKIFFG